MRTELRVAAAMIDLRFTILVVQSMSWCVPKTRQRVQVRKTFADMVGTVLLLFEPRVVWDSARGDLWRYSLERAIGARDFAFCNATTHRRGSQVRSDGRSDLENAPHSMMFPLESWQNEC